jgi:hypothetical protein
MTDFQKWALAALLVLVASCAQRPVFAQSLPAGLIYQAAAEGGIDYVNPSTGQAIIAERASVNWKTIAGSALADGSIGVLAAGLSNVIHISRTVEIGLAAFHAYYDHSIAPIIAGAAPNPNGIPPVLQATGTITPSATACAEASIYAVSAPSVLMTTVNGLSVTFASQGTQVLKRIDGSAVKQFKVVDVLVCQPGTITLPSLPSSPSVSPVPSIKKATAWIDTGELLALNR